MDAKKVLFITEGLVPYLPDSENATIARYLPQGIQERGREIRTFMPKYGCINERRNQLHEVIRLSGMNIIINDTDHPLLIKVASIQSARMQVYFIDNEDFFQRKCTLLDENGNNFDDNDERAIFYIRGVCETIRKLRWMPDLVHCHGWFSAFAPLYLKRMYADDPCFAKSKVIYSVYDHGFEQPMTKELIKKVKQDNATDRDLKVMATPDWHSLNKLAINFSDGVIQGSETIDPLLAEHIAASNKPFLTYQTAETYLDAYNAFYDTVLSTKSKHR